MLLPGAILLSSDRITRMRTQWSYWDWQFVCGVFPVICVEADMVQLWAC